MSRALCARPLAVFFDFAVRAKVSCAAWHGEYRPAAPRSIGIRGPTASSFAGEYATRSKRSRGQPAGRSQPCGANWNLLNRKAGATTHLTAVPMPRDPSARRSRQGLAVSPTPRMRREIEHAKHRLGFSVIAKLDRLAVASVRASTPAMRFGAKLVAGSARNGICKPDRQIPRID